MSEGSYERTGKREDYEVVSLAEHSDRVRLARVAESVCERYGYVGTADFVVMDKLNVRWTRGMDGGVARISLQVSDYLAGAPDKVLRSVLNYTMRRIARRRTAGSKTYRDWLMSAECRASMKPAYLARNGGSVSRVGEHRDLGASVLRLASAGLVDPEGDDVELTWSDRLTAESGLMADASSAARVVLVNRALDVPEDELSDDALDAAVFYGWVRALVAPKPTQAEYDAEVATRLAAYLGDIGEALEEADRVLKATPSADLGEEAVE